MRILAASITLTLGMLFAGMAIAGDDAKAAADCGEAKICGNSSCCGHCGCRCACEKYTKVVCEMKEVKKTIWVSKCKDFSPTNPACPLKCLHRCEGDNSGVCNQAESGGCESCKACKACGHKCDVCADLENRKYNTPNCGRVREVKSLEKKEVVCKVPSYKCVVVYCCPNCSKSESTAVPAVPTTPAAPAPTTAPVPAAPVPPAASETPAQNKSAETLSFPTSTELTLNR
jgi:hypothetical protein